MPAEAKKKTIKPAGSLKKCSGGSSVKSRSKIPADSLDVSPKIQNQGEAKIPRNRKSQLSALTDKSLKNLAQYVKRLEKENSILARELIQKKERRLKLPLLNPEDTRMAMARLNMQITETESLMAHQKKGLTDVKEIISTQENRMKDITDRISELQNDVTKKVIQPDDAKVQLEGLLQELQKLRSRREEAMAGLAV